MTLTERQVEVATYYSTYWRENGCFPSITKTAEHFGLSKVSVWRHCRILVEKGYMVDAKGSRYSLTLKGITATKPNRDLEEFMAHPVEEAGQ